MEKDTHNFTRKLRLTEYFANENDITFGEETHPPAKNKDTFHPLEIKIKRLILLLMILTITILTTQWLKTNLVSQKNEWEAIKSLKENDSIVIKQ